jgi:hypothetical protein
MPNDQSRYDEFYETRSFIHSFVHSRRDFLSCGIARPSIGIILLSAKRSKTRKKISNFPHAHVPPPRAGTRLAF